MHSPAPLDDNVYAQTADYYYLLCQFLAYIDLHRCRLLLHTSMHSVVCLTVCWSWPRATKKTLNWLRCRLGEENLVSQRNHTLDQGTRWRHLANTTEESVLSSTAGCHYHYWSYLFLIQPYFPQLLHIGLGPQNLWDNWSWSFGDFADWMPFLSARWQC